MNFFKVNQNDGQVCREPCAFVMDHVPPEFQKDNRVSVTLD